MVENTHVLDALPAYALGSLEDIEMREVSEHISACYLCRTELNSYQEIVASLALAVPEAAPPAGLKRRLAERVQGLERAQSQPARGPFLQRLLPLGGIAGLFLILALTAATFLLWQRVNRMEVLSGPNGMRAIALQSSDLAPLASGIVIIGADGLNGVLVVDQMPPLATGREYQLWLERDGQSTSAGIFPVDESGYRGVRIAVPQSLLEYSNARVTIEPAGGSSAPTGEQVLGGSLFNP
jgi:anti-sigma-K factor RskA